MYLTTNSPFFSYNNTLNVTKRSAQAVKTVESGGLVYSGGINTMRHVSFYLVLSTSTVKVKELNFPCFRKFDRYTIRSTDKATSLLLGIGIILIF